MKKRDIFLDFTSLLDVTLIVIFFFVIFSHLENLENTAKTEEKVAELEVAIENAEYRENEAANLAKKLQYEIGIVQAADNRTASNVEEIIEFTRGANIKLILEMENAEWSLKVACKDKIVGNIVQSDNVADIIKEVMLGAGYCEEDTILCDFVFDGSAPGSRGAYKTITKAIDILQEEYKYLYYSETDLSMGED